MYHLKHVFPFEELNLYKYNKNFFNEVNKGTTSISIDSVVYMMVFLRLEN